MKGDWGEVDSGKFCREHSIWRHLYNYDLYLMISDGALTSQ